MKIKEELNIDILLEYGFEKIDKAEEEKDEQYTISNFDYKYLIGHSRRGQFYYLLVGNSRNVIIYASEPDGSGGCVDLPDVLIKMFNHGIIGLNHTA